MAGVREIRIRIGRAMWPVILLLFLSYILYSGFQGDRGLISYLRLENQKENLLVELAEVTDQRQSLERRLSLMGSGGAQIDRDLLDERARTLLGMAHADDLVILRDTP